MPEEIKTKCQNIAAYTRERNFKTIYCSCGTTTHNRIWNSYRCENCNTEAKHQTKKNKLFSRVRIIRSKECLQKDDKRFHIRIHEDGYKLYFDNCKFELEETYVIEVKFDLGKKILECYKNGSKENNYNLDSLFNRMSKRELLDLISTDQSYKLFEYTIDHFAKMKYEKMNLFTRAIQRLFGYPIIEIFYSCGFRDIRYVFNEKDVLTSSAKKINTSRPHKILGVPKYMFKLLKDIEGISYLGDLISKEINGNNYKNLFESFIEESDIRSFSRCVNDLIYLIKTYKYKDMRKLALYITRDVKFQQGLTNPIEALTLLKDYRRMCSQMEKEGEKYPSSLKKMHDIALMNYNAAKSEIKNRKVTEIVGTDEYKSYEYENKIMKYIVISPKDAEDIINEGSMLSHCVASYVDDVIEKRRQIYFIRQYENKEQSLLTVEIKNRDIKQVKGRYNRLPDEREKEFIDKWMEVKKLSLTGY